MIVGYITINSCQANLSEEILLIFEWNFVLQDFLNNQIILFSISVRGNEANSEVLTYRKKRGRTWIEGGEAEWKGAGQKPMIPPSPQPRGPFQDSQNIFVFQKCTLTTNEPKQICLFTASTVFF